MHRPHLFRIAALATLLLGAGVPATTAAAAAAPASAATTTYTITDLGSLGGGITAATAINATGQVTGYSYLSKQGAICITGAPQKHCAPYHAFLWTNEKMTDLGSLGGDFSQGRAINDSGQVVGFATDSGLDLDAALWNGSRKITPLPGLNPAAIGINNSGQIIGELNFPTAVPNPPGLLTCDPVAINNNGQFLGDCVAQNPPLNIFEPRAVVWTNNTPTVLPTLGGSVDGPEARPTAFNNNGQVVGTSQTSTGATDGFLVSNGEITDLGPTFSPAAINDNGVIVGGHFIDSDGTLQNLNNLIPAGSGYQIQSATGINDNGQIITNATDTATSQQHALLLTPN